MRNTVSRKYVAIAIMFVFIGASVLPVISGANQNLNILNHSGAQGRSPPQKTPQPFVNTHVAHNVTTVHAEKTATHQNRRADKTHVSKVKPEAKMPSYFDTIKNSNDGMGTAASGSSISSGKDTRAGPRTTIEGNDAQLNKAKKGAAPLGGEDSVHDITSGYNFSAIQDAIDDETTMDGDIITVDPGTYDESVLITKEITLMPSDSTPIIDAMGADFGIAIVANNVTVDGFNITDTDIAGIICDNSSGLTLVNNTFWYDDYGIVYFDEGIALSSDYTIYDNVVMNNVFYMESSDVSVTVGIDLNYASTSSYTVTIGDISITNNTFYMNETAATAISFSSMGEAGIYVYNLQGGTLSVGTINISGNNIYGGNTGFDFYGDLSNLKNVHVSVGDFIVYS